MARVASSNRRHLSTKRSRLKLATCAFLSGWNAGEASTRTQGPSAELCPARSRLGPLTGAWQVPCRPRRYAGHVQSLAAYSPFLGVSRAFFKAYHGTLVQRYELTAWPLNVGDAEQGYLYLSVAQTRRYVGSLPRPARQVKLWAGSGRTGAYRRTRPKRTKARLAHAFASKRNFTKQRLPAPNRFLVSHLARMSAPSPQAHGGRGSAFLSARPVMPCGCSACSGCPQSGILDQRTVRSTLGRFLEAYSVRRVRAAIRARSITEN
jgi:hypothetical protein